MGVALCAAPAAAADLPTKKSPPEPLVAPPLPSTWRFEITGYKFGEKNHFDVEYGLAILNAAGLSFIGLGVRAPQAEWGIMVAEGATYIISGEWWVALFPGLWLMAAVFCFNLMGDGLRDIVDPRRRT